MDGGSHGVTPPDPTPQLRTSVRLDMRVSRPQLYTLNNALINLTNQAGSVRIIVEAIKANGFDAGWLRNAVLEPLEEADIEVQESSDAASR
jgi:hypothetical protein